MQGEKRKPFSKAINPEDPLIDEDISTYVNILSNLKIRDFGVKQKFDDVKPLLTSEELSKLNLCKLLYCTGHKKEMFLHLGVLLESRLNAIIDIYISQNWQTPNNYDSSTIEQQFIQFKKNKTLNDKADIIYRLNLFNNLDTSDRIRHKLQSFRFLRNYGGHAKSVNEFLDAIIDSQPDCDNEIEEVCNLISQIEVASSILISNPPPVR